MSIAAACPDGTPMIAKRTLRPHGNHNPQHGGQFFMAPDNFHHLEGAYPRAGVFRLYLYDDYARPLPPDAGQTRQGARRHQRNPRRDHARDQGDRRLPAHRHAAAISKRESTARRRRRRCPRRSGSRTMRRNTGSTSRSRRYTKEPIAPSSAARTASAAAHRPPRPRRVRPHRPHATGHACRRRAAGRCRSEPGAAADSRHRRAR